MQACDDSLCFHALYAGRFSRSKLCYRAAALLCSGERLTFRLRQMCFNSLLRQPMAFYDQPENASGIVLTRLATDASLVQSLAANRIDQSTTILAMIVAGMVIAFVNGWKLALVVLSTGPLMAFSGWVQFKFVGGFSSEAKKSTERAGRVANESVANIRTVAAFCAERPLLKRFEQMLAQNHKQALKSSHVSGIGFGLSQFIMFASYGLSFWYGGQLVHDGEMSFANVMTVFFAIATCAMGVGQTAQLAPDYRKAELAAAEIFRLVDSKSTIDPLMPSGEPLKLTGGEIQFRNLVFEYPTRKDQPIFKGLNLTVPANTTMALVGPSGAKQLVVLCTVAAAWSHCNCSSSPFAAVSLFVRCGGCR